MSTLRFGDPFPDSFAASIAIISPASISAPFVEGVERVLSRSSFSGLLIEICWAMNRTSSEELWQWEAMEIADIVVVNLAGDLDLAALPTRRRRIYAVATKANPTAITAIEGLTVFQTLTECIEAAVCLIGTGSLRSGPERSISLDIWNTDSFRRWHDQQLSNRNRLLASRLEWVHYIQGPTGPPLFYAIHVSVWVSSEDRVKSNEVVLGRPDIASVVAFCPNGDPLLTEILLVREFRAPGIARENHLLTLPSGSDFGRAPNKHVAQAELLEETGLSLPLNRLQSVQTRQLCGTMLVTSSALFSVELSPVEIRQLRNDPYLHGSDASERTTVEIARLQDLLKGTQVDWSTLGMIIAAVNGHAEARMEGV